MNSNTYSIISDDTVEESKILYSRLSEKNDFDSRRDLMVSLMNNLCGNDIDISNVVLGEVGLPPYTNEEILKLTILSGDINFAGQVERKLARDKEFLESEGISKDITLMNANRMFTGAELIRDIITFFEENWL